MNTAKDVRLGGSILALGAMLALAAGTVAAPESGKSSRTVGAVRVTARTMDISDRQWVLSGGRPTAQTSDGAFFVEADRIVVHLNRQAGSRADFVSRIDAAGNVNVRSLTPDGQPVRVTSRSAVYSGKDSTLVFEGDVVVTLASPDLEEPGVMRAAWVTYYMKAGPDETRFRVEGQPAEVRATPKARAQEGAGPGK
jgi:lipopolysaccharide export system protein LptA